jgi:hypothetical protein
MPVKRSKSSTTKRRAAGGRGYKKTSGATKSKSARPTKKR